MILRSFPLWLYNRRMNTQIFEFKPNHNDPEKQPSKINPKKSENIPLGLSRLESMDDNTTADIIRKINDFSKLKFRSNKDIYNRYVEEIEKHSLTEIIETAAMMTDADLLSRPNYTKALFDVFSRKIKEVKV